MGKQTVPYLIWYKVLSNIESIFRKINAERHGSEAFVQWHF